jgi:hypothetical protein
MLSHFDCWRESPAFSIPLWICRCVSDFEVIQQFVKVSLKFTAIVCANCLGHPSEVCLRVTLVSVEHLNQRHFLDRSSIHAITSERVR